MKHTISKEKDKIFKFLFLETLEDLREYKALNEQIKAKQAVGFWFAFHSQKGFVRPNPSDFAAHELESGNEIARVLALKMRLEGEMLGKSWSIMDYCNEADVIINQIHESMHDYLSRNKLVKINLKGGFYSADQIESDCEDVVSINSQQLKNFLLNRDINEGEPIITSHTIAIENDSYIPKSSIDKYCALTKSDSKDIQVITSFKLKTILFQDQDWINFFLTGKKAGLKNIILETTYQDSRQIKNVQSILEKLNMSLNIYVKLYYSGTDRDELLKTDNKNINVVLLN